MSGKFGLTRTVSISERGYAAVEKMSKLTGLPMGELVTKAVTKAYDTDKNPRARAAVGAAREVLIAALD